jgi:hypothetical protein
MRIYLLDVRMNLWFAGQQQWTSSPAEAVAFRTSTEALTKYAELEKENPRLQLMLCFNPAIPVLLPKRSMRIPAQL